MNVPAATAVPITPATFGPIACISRKFVGSASAPTFWDTRAAIGTADTPAEPIRGLIFPLSNLAHKLTKHNTGSSTERKGNKTKNYDLQCIYIQECLSTCGSTYGCTEKDYYDVHKSVGSCLRKLFNNAGLTEQVSEHQHTNKGSCCRKDQANNDCDNDREKDLLKF